MILVCGIPSEAPVAMVIEEIIRLGVSYKVFNQRNFDGMSISFEIDDANVTGKLRIDQVTYALEDFEGVYVRLMDDQLLPELKDEPANSPKRQSCRALHDTMIRWCEVTPARVVNRSVASSSNFSKPYQMQLIRKHGFKVPATVITNDPEVVKEFMIKHPLLIYKSMSSVRSIVKTLEKEDLCRLDLIKWCPVQFQEFVEGTNVRVHTVGSEVFATEVTTNATDYRYPNQTEQGETNLSAFKLGAGVSRKCVELSKALGLAFAGIDLKYSPDGCVYCFEVNPNPGFSYYESSTGQPIANAVASYLGGV
jgi:hypothetical protein